MMMIVFPVLFLTLLSPSEACFKPPPVCPNDKQSCIADNNDNVLQIKEVSNPLKCSKLAKLSLSVLLKWLSFVQLMHTGLEALSSKKKVSVHGTGVPVFLRPVWYWDGVAKPEKMGKK